MPWIGGAPLPEARWNVRTYDVSGRDRWYTVYSKMSTQKWTQLVMICKWFHDYIIYIYTRICLRIYIIYHMGVVPNRSLFMRCFTYLALVLAPSCAFQGFSAKSCPNTKLVYFAFHEACLARVTFTICSVFICRHLFPRFSELLPQLEWFLFGNWMYNQNYLCNKAMTIDDQLCDCGVACCQEKTISNTNE